MRDDMESIIKIHEGTDSVGRINNNTPTANDDSQNFLVIGTWQTLENWIAWKKNQARKSLEAMLEIYQEGPTHYEEYVVGASFPE